LPLKVPDTVSSLVSSPEGKTIKVEPLTAADRRMIVRWIDLGCPIDLDPTYDPQDPASQSAGYLADDTRPTLTMTEPAAGKNPPLTRVLLGMHDYASGLDLETFRVTADFPLAGTPAGENLAPKFTPLPGNRWELRLAAPASVDRGTLTVSIQDRSGNVTHIERTFSTSVKTARK